MHMGSYQNKKHCKLKSSNYEIIVILYFLTYYSICYPLTTMFFSSYGLFKRKGNIILIRKIMLYINKIIIYIITIFDGNKSVFLLSAKFYFKWPFQ